MTPLNTTKTTQAASILQRSVCLTLECHYLGNNRRVDLEELVGTEQKEDGTTIDESVFHATKRLLDPKVLRPCHRKIGQAKSLLRGRAVSAHRVFGERSYLIPIMDVEAIDAELTTLSGELAEEAALLAAVYTQAVEDQRVKLGAHFKASDYVTPAEVMKAHRIDWSFVSFESPDRLETVSMALAQKSRAKYETRLSHAYEETVLQVRSAALSVMQGLVEKLGPGKDGKPKGLRGTALDDVLEFCNRLPSLNSIAGDDDLTAAVAQVQAVVSGVDVKQLRDSQALRDAVQKVASDASAVLEGLVVAGRGRAISFSEVK